MALINKLPYASKITDLIECLIDPSWDNISLSFIFNMNLIW